MNVHSVKVTTSASAEATPPKRDKRAEKRERILDAAVELFVERGFYGTAVPLVAKAAGISTGSIYNYFENKEALVNAVFRRHKQAIATHVFNHFPADGEPRAQFASMWQYMADFALQHPKAFAFLELHRHTSYLDEESLAIENQLRLFGAAMIQRAQVANVLKPMDTTVMMELVFGAFIGVMRAHYEGRIEVTEAILRETEQACWDAISLP